MREIIVLLRTMIVFYLFNSRLHSIVCSILSFLVRTSRVRISAALPPNLSDGVWLTKIL